MYNSNKEPAIQSKTAFAVCLVVFTLHIAVFYALLKIPSPPIKTLSVTQPLEITMIDAAKKSQKSDAQDISADLSSDTSPANQQQTPSNQQTNNQATINQTNQSATKESLTPPNTENNSVEPQPIIDDSNTEKTKQANELKNASPGTERFSESFESSVNKGNQTETKAIEVIKEKTTAEKATQATITSEPAQSKDSTSHQTQSSVESAVVQPKSPQSVESQNQSLASDSGNSSTSGTLSSTSQANNAKSNESNNAKANATKSNASTSIDDNQSDEPFQNVAIGEEVNSSRSTIINVQQSTKRNEASNHANNNSNAALPKPTDSNSVPARASRQIASTGSSWVKKPVFNLKDVAGKSGTVLNIVLELTVDKSGNITRTKVLQSSNNTAVDIKVQQQIKQAKLKPFLQNGIPVGSTVTIPIAIQIP